VVSPTDTMSPAPNVHHHFPLGGRWTFAPRRFKTTAAPDARGAEERHVLRVAWEVTLEGETVYEAAFCSSVLLD
jgi:hypothetical protein